jgi:transposase
MSLHAKDNTGVPEETVRVAKAAFPKGNAYITLRDELDTLYRDEMFQSLFPGRGQPAESPGQLALVTVLQFAENLSDRQAADAVRSRIDWKYLLGLELTDPGFDASVLSEFRNRLIAGGVEQQLLDQLLERMKEKGVIKPRGRQRTDATHVQAAIRQLNRLERVGETLRTALNQLAVLTPEWLQARVPLEWRDRYGSRFESYRLPKSDKAREALAIQIGRDGYQVLEWVNQPDAPAQLKTELTVRILWRVWMQEYYRQDDDVNWRTPDNMPPAEQLIQSPYDAEARFGKKRDNGWVGYKAHFTEICDTEQPHLITHVETTPATVPDSEVTRRIHQALALKDLLPKEHLLDTGYVDAKLLVDSQLQFGVEMIGPAMPDSSWQAKAGQGFELACFTIDWEKQQVHCPQGQTSQSWSKQRDKQGNATIQVAFHKRTCQSCVSRQVCTRATQTGRKLRFRPQAEHEALQHLRRVEQTPEFKEKYQKRAGVEGTLSQGVRSFDLRRTRYIGYAKARLQNILIAIAINLARFANWIREFPTAITRTSPFAALLPVPL